MYLMIRFAIEVVNTYGRNRTEQEQNTAFGELQ